MSQTSVEDHYARAGRRHYEDADYLLDDGRLPNVDYHYGFAVECALKSMLLRYHRNVTMDPTKPAPVARLADGNEKSLRHLPKLWSDVAALLHGRSGRILAGVLTQGRPFATWSVHHRYTDGSAITKADVDRRRAAAGRILSLHAQALISGDLP